MNIWETISNNFYETNSILTMVFDPNNLLREATDAPTGPATFAEYMSYEQHQHDMAHSKQNMEERKLYACWIFQFTCVWCIGMFVILVGCGLNKLQLSTTVITTFIGSTTINVFIFFKLVTEYLFNKDNPHS